MVHWQFYRCLHLQMHTILIDINVLLDYLLARAPFYEDARKIMLACTEGKTKGCIAVHSISNIFFNIKKRL